MSAHEQANCELTCSIKDEYHKSVNIYGSPRIIMRLKVRGVHISRDHGAQYVSLLLGKIVRNHSIRPALDSISSL